MNKHTNASSIKELTTAEKYRVLSFLSDPSIEPLGGSVSVAMVYADILLERHKRNDFEFIPEELYA